MNIMKNLIAFGIAILFMSCVRSLHPLFDNGFDPETVKWVIQAVDKNEYKRRQGPPGLKVTTKALGVGRKMPIAAKTEM